MVAINELLDFRHFGSTNEVKSDNNDTIADKPNFNQNVSPMLRKLLNKTT